MITTQLEREQVFTRARRFVGSDEHLLSPIWLSRSDVFCVAEENENHGVHHNLRSLQSCLALFPEDKWCALEVIDEDNLLDPVAIPSPGFRSLATSTGVDLASYYQGRGFMLFSMEHDAVILYSAEYEYKLVAGAANFVRSYICNADDDPLSELQTQLHDNIVLWRENGNTDYAAAIQRALDTALSQVKLPPLGVQGVGKVVT